MRAVRQIVDRARRAAPGERGLTDQSSNWLRLQLRTWLLSKQVLVHGSAMAGLGFVPVLGDLFARASDAEPVPVGAFGPTWSMWHDLLAMPAIVATVRVVTPALVERAICA